MMIYEEIIMKISIPRMIYKRNKKMQKLVAARTSEVGIFWFWKNDIIAEGRPWSEGEDFGKYKIYPDDHSRVWNSYKRKGVLTKVYNIPEKDQKEYFLLERGRVVCLPKADKYKFIVYFGRKPSSAEKSLILKEFNLPLASTKFEYDDHYDRNKQSAIEDGMHEGDDSDDLYSEELDIAELPRMDDIADMGSIDDSDDYS